MRSVPAGALSTLNEMQAAARTVVNEVQAAATTVVNEVQAVAMTGADGVEGGSDLGHDMATSGSVIWCRKCGCYADARVLAGLLGVCKGPPSIGQYGGKGSAACPP